MRMGTSVKDMVRAYLTEHGYDGLCNPDTCGCDLKELMACDCVNETLCVAAYKAYCAKCARRKNDCPHDVTYYEYLMLTDGPCGDYEEGETDE